MHILPDIVVVIIRINIIELSISFKAVERLYEDQLQLSCHQIGCNVTLMYQSVGTV